MPTLSSSTSDSIRSSIPGSPTQHLVIAVVLAFPALICPNVAFAQVDYVRDIKPILSDNCYTCHGPDESQRQGGDPDAGGLRLDQKATALADLGGYTAITPGKPEDSELIERINSTDPDLVMPPATHRKRLSDQQKALLQQWVKQGAKWSEHWAYVAPKRVHSTSTGTVNSQTVNSNWIDQFIHNKLDEHNLKPSPQSERHILLRRIYFDLIGLPPTSAEVAAFRADTSDTAWETVVDRLLKSPHFGERLAIYWLDLVRYADSVGYHGDQNVSVSPYRDYVIDAFNANMPFDRFTKEQLAGDLLPNPTLQQRIASGYNRLGMMSAEGGVQPKEYLAKYASDRVRNASGVWMGSTLGCAECHDHKFDPFSTKDFYRFAAFFADIKEKGLYSGGKFGTKIDVADPKLQQLLPPIDAEISALQQVLKTSTKPLQNAQQQWELELAQHKTQWVVIKPAEVRGLSGVKLKVLDKENSILASGGGSATNTYTVTTTTQLKGITGFRLDVLPHKSLPKQGPGRAGNGNFVVTEFTARLGDTLIPLQNATASREQGDGKTNPWGGWKAAATIDSDEKGATWGWAILPDSGKQNQLVVETSTPAGDGSEQLLTFEVQQNHKNHGHTLGHFRISVTTSAQPLTANTGGNVPPEVLKILNLPGDKRNPAQLQAVATYYRSIAPALQPTRNQLAKQQKQRTSIVQQHTRTTLVTEQVEPRVMRVLGRGDWMDESGEIVQPGIPQFLGGLQANADGTNNDARANRTDLADWLTSPNNPLTARVFVNRLWKLYFGSGLSSVLDDVGSQGEPPSHPELLDNLAIEFVDSGWDIKHMIKLMVMSAAYRQSSLMRDDLADTDPYNRLLARQSRFRFDAELVRDNALAVSGLLVTKVGGQSVKPYQPVGLYRHLNFPKREYKADAGESQYRRGLYTHWQRQFLHPAMKSFDAPAREECTAQRTRSNTPLAALVLLNDPSYVEAARVFAENAIKAQSTTNERISWIFEAALSRQPTSDEVAVLGSLLDQQRQRFKDKPAAVAKLVQIGLSPSASDIDPLELVTWMSVTRAIFNTHEFITRN